VAVSEPVFWRLMALQSVMANALEFDAGLNPRLWRLYQRSSRGCRNNDRKKGVIDGNLVFRYANLSFPEREDLASSIGTTVDLIMDNLVDIQCANKII
jgi:cleavage and polyadenylation specificity factor subunit 1